MPATRRTILRSSLTAGALAAARGLPLPGPDDDRPRSPGSRPYPWLPKGHDCRPQIEHIVVLMMENHSYDNRLGRDGLPLASNPYPDGRVQRAFRMPTTCQLTAKPAQDRVDSHIQYNGGRNDGFVRSASGPVAMAYWLREDQPFYDSLASVFHSPTGTSPRCLGQNFPKRRYLLAGTSFGQVGDDLPTISTQVRRRRSARPRRSRSW